MRPADLYSSSNCRLRSSWGCWLCHEKYSIACCILCIRERNSLRTEACSKVFLMTLHRWERCLSDMPFLHSGHKKHLPCSRISGTCCRLDCLAHPAMRFHGCPDGRCPHAAPNRRAKTGRMKSAFLFRPLDVNVCFCLVAFGSSLGSGHFLQDWEQQRRPLAVLRLYNELSTSHNCSC